MEHRPKSSDARPRSDRAKRARKIGRHAVRLTAREYLPMFLLIAFWAVTALGIGHADAARLLAATVLMRATLMLSQMTTLAPLRRRADAPKAVRQRSLRTAGLVQLGVLAVLLLETVILYAGLSLAGQPLVAEMLVILAIGYPPRLYRDLDFRVTTHLFQLIAAIAGLIGAAASFWGGLGPIGFALAYALRDWAAILTVRLFGLSLAAPSKLPTDEPLTFEEIARNTVVTSRRRLTYRLTKTILTVFGPFGNFAARTGRGLKLYTRLEPYMPHNRGGFWIFALGSAVIAMVLIVRSGKPVAIIAGAGALQLAALALNVLVWWRYLPNRGDGAVLTDEDDDD